MTAVLLKIRIFRNVTSFRLVKVTDVSKERNDSVCIMWPRNSLIIKKQVLCPSKTLITINKQA